MSGEEGREWQRLDHWLWCARFMRHRADCARLIAGGTLRINRQPTDKPHARLRVGDILTIALARQVRVIVVQALAERRGPPPDARALYREIPDGDCGGGRSVAYPPSVQTDPPDTRSA